MKKWQKVITKKVYNFGRFYRVEVDDAITPGGKIVEYSVVRMDPFPVIIPIDSDGMIYFVKQHRYTTDQITIELPMGNSDGEDFLVAAKRELEEEAGLQSDDWVSLGRIQEANGIGELYGHIFLAKNVNFVVNPRKDPLDKDLLEIVKYGVDEIKQMIADGAICDAVTICALSKAIFFNKI